ncbi:MAG TPA: hypothetical protein VH724_09950, partial [Candidatus Angelobacter sp.]|nr:hypothetical protein [Candidatus Angelobacter sp.]
MIENKWEEITLFSEVWREIQFSKSYSRTGQPLGIKPQPHLTAFATSCQEINSIGCVNGSNGI